MTADEARALAMSYELSAHLYTLGECRGRHPRIEAAMDMVDGAIQELEALGLPDHGKQTPHTLRLLVTDPGGYVEHRTGQAMRSLARTPWRRS